MPRVTLILQEKILQKCILSALVSLEAIQEIVQGASDFLARVQTLRKCEQVVDGRKKFLVLGFETADHRAESRPSGNQHSEVALVFLGGEVEAQAIANHFQELVRLRPGSDGFIGGRAEVSDPVQEGIQARVISEDRSRTAEQGRDSESIRHVPSLSSRLRFRRSTDTRQEPYPQVQAASLDVAGEGADDFVSRQVLPNARTILTSSSTTFGLA
jgi:hypothetical protein